MGREVRMVPPWWVHPRDGDRTHRDGSPAYKPMYDRSFLVDEAEWLECKRHWDAGEVEDWENGGWKPKDSSMVGRYEDYDGEYPDPTYYMPDWPKEQRTHFQMYEDTSEGTPISPIFETPEELARWLADNGTSFFGGQRTSYEHWLGIVKGTSIGLPVLVSTKKEQP